MQKTLKIFTDGGARGNPGPAASGVSIVGHTGEELIGIGKTLGIATNNVAEYTAVLLAMEWLTTHPDTVNQYNGISFFLDSQLVCFQLQGKYRIKNQPLLQIATVIQQKRKQLAVPVTFSHIPRAENKRADSLVNMALDNKIETPYN